MQIYFGKFIISTLVNYSRSCHPDCNHSFGNLLQQLHLHRIHSFNHNSSHSSNHNSNHNFDHNFNRSFNRNSSHNFDRSSNSNRILDFGHRILDFGHRSRRNCLGCRAHLDGFGHHALFILPSSSPPLSKPFYLWLRPFSLSTLTVNLVYYLATKSFSFEMSHFLYLAYSLEASCSLLSCKSTHSKAYGYQLG